MNLSKASQLIFFNDKDSVMEANLLSYVKMHGRRCMSYSTLQPGLNYGVLDGEGYIAWIEVRTIPGGNHSVVLSNPIISPHRQLDIISMLCRERSKVTLVQIDDGLAEKLYSNGFKVYQIGIESELDIKTFHLKGKCKASLRQWKNKILREKVTTEEKKISDMDKQEVLNLCHSWLEGRGGKELSFLTRPMPCKNEEDVRFFWTREGRKLIGVAGFDPIYTDGKLTGYYHNFDRIHTEAVNGASAFTLLHALEIFRNEGKELLSLGLSPLAGMEAGYNLTGPFKKIAGFFFKYGERVYPFKGNARHKSKFCGRRKKVYVASNSGWFDTMVASAIACGLDIKPS